ncbi:XdhC family protein [Thalassotalea sp. 1_MG-2023]|uniref:XdhC family protein n=1 Tax=Thalassotalea sp. 1_MG-2023 TaxID=3062680 RepID=UPI0026E35492|nr:XdhC family protein [Thalassotalea sp. 1_MG-2023]MDO6426388.1 XdhC family protein [Thalassotalea sp. 1_MG-2023]
MQENWLQIAADFSSEQNYVLATIVATKGSTYRKTGTMMLISEQGQCTGLLSGGCLEADITLHAQEVLTNGKSKLLTYDLKADADLLWGLGLGCDGAIDIYLQPLTTLNSHLEFVLLLDAVQQGESGYYCQQVTENLAGQAKFIVANSDIDRENFQRELPEGDWLITPVTPIFSLLICGAGPDVVPLVTMVEQLGWRVTLQDHRKAYLEQPAFSHCFAKRKLRAEQASVIDYQGFDAIVVMTHNLNNDGEILKHALAANIGYIGLLGPAGRRDKLLNALSLTASDVQQQVFGPIGLNIGGRSPQAIALSICAEIQQFISHQQQSNKLKSWRIQQ